MLRLSPGSRVYKLLQLLSVCGEFPAKSLSILGNERAVKRTVHKYESVQDIHFELSGKCYTQKLFQANGKREMRTIRLCKGAFPILNELHPNALEYYQSTFNTNFSSGFSHITRNHRVGEALAMLMQANIEICPYKLPKLQYGKNLHIVPETPCFYTARNLKKIHGSALNKNTYARMVGLLSYSSGAYAVYNTRDDVMFWKGKSEFKARDDLTTLVVKNTSSQELDSAILFGETPDIALETIEESDKGVRNGIKFDSVYKKIHFIPMNQDGIRLLRILILPDWKEALLSKLLPESIRLKKPGFMEYDGRSEGKYIYSHVDSDLARLYNFRFQLKANKEVLFFVICLPWQVKLLEQYLKDYKDRVEIKTYDMEKFEKVLGITEE